MSGTAFFIISFCKALIALIKIYLIFRGRKGEGAYSGKEHLLNCRTSPPRRCRTRGGKDWKYLYRPADHSGDDTVACCWQKGVYSQTKRLFKRQPVYICKQAVRRSNNS